MPELNAVAPVVTVPRLIHYVWVGGPIPGPAAQHDYRAGITGVAAVMPLYEVNVWLSRRYSSTDEAYAENRAWCEAAQVQPRNIDTDLLLAAVERTALELQWTIDRPNYGAMSDIARVAILDVFGGIYLDTDCGFGGAMPDPQVLPCPYGFAATRRIWNSHKMINSIMATVPEGAFVRTLRQRIVARYAEIAAQGANAQFTSLRYALELRGQTTPDAEAQKRSAIEAKTILLAGPDRLATVAGEFTVRENPANPNSPLRPLYSPADGASWNNPGVAEFIIPYVGMPGLPAAQAARLPLYGNPQVEFHNTWLPPPVPAAQAQAQPQGHVLDAPVAAPLAAPTADPAADD